jgi:uncharacterized protein (DUF1697 family)
MPAFVALLYSVVLAPGRRVVMSELRDMAAELGLKDPRTLVATGNLVFGTRATDPRALEARLEAAFERRFGRHVDIIVRDAAGWRRLVAGNPFPEAAQARPDRVAVRVMRAPMPPEVADALDSYRSGRERLALVDGDLWLHLPDGFAKSRLVAAITPARCSIGTARNWNTVRRVEAMVA